MSPGFAGRLRPKLSIQSVNACAPRPSAASIARDDLRIVDRLEHLGDERVLAHLARQIGPRRHDDRQKRLNERRRIRSRHPILRGDRHRPAPPSGLGLRPRTRRGRAHNAPTASKVSGSKLEHRGRGRDYRASSVLAFSHWASVGPSQRKHRLAGTSWVLGCVPATLCSKHPTMAPRLHRPGPRKQFVLPKPAASDARPGRLPSSRAFCFPVGWNIPLAIDWRATAAILVTMPFGWGAAAVAAGEGLQLGCAGKWTAHCDGWLRPAYRARRGSRLGLVAAAR